MTIAELCQVLTKHPEIRSITLSPEAYDRFAVEAQLSMRYGSHGRHSNQCKTAPTVLTCMGTAIRREIPYDPFGHFPELTE